MGGREGGWEGGREGAHTVLGILIPSVRLFWPTQGVLYTHISLVLLTHTTATTHNIHTTLADPVDSFCRQPAYKPAHILA